MSDWKIKRSIELKSTPEEDIEDGLNVDLKGAGTMSTDIKAGKREYELPDDIRLSDIKRVYEQEK